MTNTMPATSLPASMLLASTLFALSACATTASGPDIPEGARESTRTEANGDVITEYRVGTQLRVVKVTPARGPAYYLYDRDSDGIVDRDGDNPPQTWFKLFEW
jgi:hypothetical protein